jgi:predicted RNase H-like HicB family nuclease
MSHYIAVIVPRAEGGWRAYLPDIPGCRAESQELDSAIFGAIRAASELIGEAQHNGERPTPRTLEEIRTDAAWAAEPVDWTKALVSVVPLQLPK